ncbi:MAG: hypothetical protein KatS3mg001_437 [Candidatus Pacearchaeota archaeon]|nr:MAG: hypothetical protein KatS3mg001_437 [Candidatus Pacearchaeota archaeon]
MRNFLKRGGSFFKKGQVAIFIIIAILAVGAILSIYFLNRSARTTERFEETNPQTFIQNCIEESLNNAIETISLQGGSANPEGYLEYKGYKIEYACYTAEDFKTCVVQKPFLQSHIENEIKKEIEEEFNFCFNQLVRNYEDRGYNVNFKKGNLNVRLVPKRIIVNTTNEITVTKGNTQTFKDFEIVVNSNLYELVWIANSILEFEASLGDADPTIYMDIFRWIKVEKISREREGVVYIITDRRSGDKFQFASRSLEWSPGHEASRIAIY